MKIVSKIKRKGGTKITLDGEVYHFKPDENGTHVAEVKNKKHIQRFLSIPEGYCQPGCEDDYEPPAPEGRPIPEDPEDNLEDDENVEEEDSEPEEEDSEPEEEDEEEPEEKPQPPRKKRVAKKKATPRKR